jgi:hypothetical protein
LGDDVVSCETVDAVAAKRREMMVRIERSMMNGDSVSR